MSNKPIHIDMWKGQITWVSPSPWSRVSKFLLKEHHSVMHVDILKRKWTSMLLMVDNSTVLQLIEKENVTLLKPFWIIVSLLRMLLVVDSMPTSLFEQSITILRSENLTDVVQPYMTIEERYELKMILGWIASDYNCPGPMLYVNKRPHNFLVLLKFGCMSYHVFREQIILQHIALLVFLLFFLIDFFFSYLTLINLCYFIFWRLQKWDCHFCLLKKSLYKK